MNHRLFTLVATAGPPLFAALTVVAGLVKPGYDIAEQTVSDLAVGDYGWIQTANFLILGVAILAYAVSRRSLAFGVAATGTILSAFYETDLAGAPVTSHGTLFIAIALVCITVSAAKQLDAVAPGIRRVEAANAR